METIMNGKSPCVKFPPSKFGGGLCSNSRSSRIWSTVNSSTTWPVYCTTLPRVTKLRPSMTSTRRLQPWDWSSPRISKMWLFSGTSFRTESLENTTMVEIRFVTFHEIRFVTFHDRRSWNVTKRISTMKLRLQTTTLRFWKPMRWTPKKFLHSRPNWRSLKNPKQQWQQRRGKSWQAD